MKAQFLILLIFLFSFPNLKAHNWKDIETVDALCKAYPKQMEALLDKLNLDYPGLEKIKAAADKGQVVQACQELLIYYRNGENAGHLRIELPEPGTGTVSSADTILKNVFTIQNVKGKVPVGEDGHRDWYYKGPNNDKEWAWLSNRHSQIRTVLSAYLKTGNPKYAQYIDLFLRDFIIKSWPYPAKKTSTSVWRGLEVSFRSKAWTAIFYNLLHSEYLTDVTRLLILTSLPDHAHYNRNFHGSNNWLTMEISALATVATHFPEYADAKEWMDYSIEQMMESMKDQIYPDGVQTELTSHYHNVSLNNFELFQDLCEKAEVQLPEFYDQTIRDMYSYISHAIRPDGNRILNNDGDLGSDRKLVLAGAEKYQREDWKYIATNGKAGTKPEDGPSYFYPWAGQLISRSGFNENSHWSFFDIGPWGSGHQHSDKLHLSVAAFGRDLLVDAGRFAYTGEIARKFRRYSRSTQAHNTFLIDGMGQKPDIKVTRQALDESHFIITDDYDYAWNSYDNYEEITKVKHSRTLLYVREKFWVVVDRVASRQPRKVDVLWHWHPDCKVEIQPGAGVSTTNEIGNLSVFPVGDNKWKIELVEGREEPGLQGWYSEEYNTYEPNKVTIFSKELVDEKPMIWLLVPWKTEAVPTQAKIVSQNDEGVTLHVEQEGRNWELEIPYSDSRKVELQVKSKK